MPAGTTNHIYISRSSTFSERNKFIQLIHPIKGVLGTLSPVSQLIVPAELVRKIQQTVQEKPYVLSCNMNGCKGTKPGDRCPKGHHVCWNCGAAALHRLRNRNNTLWRWHHEYRSASPHGITEYMQNSIDSLSAGAPINSLCCFKPCAGCARLS